MTCYYLVCIQKQNAKFVVTNVKYSPTDIKRQHRGSNSVGTERNIVNESHASSFNIVCIKVYLLINYYS